MLYVWNTYQDMDSFEINKIIASILLTALIIIGIGKIVDVLFYVEKPKISAYKVEGIDQSTSDKETSVKSVKAVEAVDIKALLAMGDLAHGEKVFKKIFSTFSFITVLIQSSKIVWFLTWSNGLGFSSVKGFSLLPNPAHKIKAVFIFIFF